MPLAVFALALGAFAISTTEFVILGLLLNVSQDFGISISDAGFLVTAYAIGVVIGAPLLTPILARYPRKKVIVFLLALFTIGNAIAVFAPNYETLLFSRVFTALVHASFYGLSSIVASQLVSKDKQARAMSMVFMGATIANIAGAPLGTMIGLEFGWRSTSIACAILGFLAMIGISLLVPKVKTEKPKNIAAEFRTLLQPQVIRALLLTLVGFAGTFTLLTYIAPLLIQLTGFVEGEISMMLFIFGLGMAIGNPIGGWLTDKDLKLALNTTLGFLFVILIAIGLLSSYMIPMYVLTFLFGAALFATITPLQVNAMIAAGDAPVMAASFNIAAFNLANALAAVIGGYVIDSSLGINFLPFAAASFALLGLAFALSTQKRSTKSEVGESMSSTST
ncbi:arabinose transporter permease [Pseudoalteromonas sp. MSK9-3]|nr:arabinose transporter permease [Pseudoalteromonas sp. MSK9-3]